MCVSVPQQDVEVKTVLPLSIRKPEQEERREARGERHLGGTPSEGSDSTSRPTSEEAWSIIDSFIWTASLPSAPLGMCCDRRGVLVRLDVLMRCRGRPTDSSRETRGPRTKSSPLLCCLGNRAEGRLSGRGASCEQQWGPHVAI